MRPRYERFVALANQGARELQLAIGDNPNPKDFPGGVVPPIEKFFAAKRRMKGAEIAVNAASRILGRYKELVVDDRRPPPMFFVPDGDEMEIDTVEPVAPKLLVVDTTAVPVNGDGQPVEEVAQPEEHE